MIRKIICSIGKILIIGPLPKAILIGHGQNYYHKIAQLISKSRAEYDVVVLLEPVRFGGDDLPYSIRVALRAGGFKPVEEDTPFSSYWMKDFSDTHEIRKKLKKVIEE